MKKLYLLIFLTIAIGAVIGIYYAVKNWQPLSSNEKGRAVIEERITREEVMTDVSEKIGKISPAGPVLGGKWQVRRFWFVQDSNKDFYVEYEDGHILRRILVETGKKEGKLNYKVVAYFEPGEVDWTLKDGEDKFFGSLLDLYEYSEELEKWIKRN